MPYSLFTSSESRHDVDVARSLRRKDQLARVLTVHKPNGDPEMFRGEQRSGFFRPLEHDDPAAVQHLVQPEVLELLGTVEPVQVDVVDGRCAAIFAEKRERGAGDMTTRTSPRRNPAG